MTQPALASSPSSREPAFDWQARTWVMGIINVTPDSFSGDGLLGRGAEEDISARVVAQALHMAAEGADILDVGGESTRPGSVPISTAEELARVIPSIRAIRAACALPISVDTSKAMVARQALAAGANLINDVWGLRLDPAMAGLVAETGVPVVLMHNHSRPKDAEQRERLGGRYVGVAYSGLLTDIATELSAQIVTALAAGIAPEQIILDPGIGFGKTVEQNLQLVQRLGELRALGYPLLIGPSRKSFIGYTLDVPPEQRVEGTLAAIGVAMCQQAAQIVRVHDVGPTVRFVRMMEAILKA